MKKFLYLVALGLLSACSGLEPPLKTQLVVEGWIDSGGHPMVLVSETMGVGGEPIRREDMIGNIAKWAKVTVSDGQTSEILTGTVDPRYFPPYVYTTSRITGEVGKTYTVDVEYKDYHATATTTIPDPVPLDTLYCVPLRDTLYRVMCGFTDPPEKGNYYKVFTQTLGKDLRYQPSVMAMASDEVFDGYAEIYLWSTQRLTQHLYFPDICEGDELMVKFCTMDRVTFSFWENYEITLASNVNSFYQFDSDLGANVHGALGYWAGYGVSEYHISVRPPEP